MIQEQEKLTPVIVFGKSEPCAGRPVREVPDKIITLYCCFALTIEHVFDIIGLMKGTTQQIREVFAAIDRFGQRPKSGRDPDELGVELIELRRAVDRLELEFAETAATFARTEEYDRQGSTTPIDWIRHHCQMAGAAAADRVRVGEHLDKLPRSAEAVREGSIGFAHLSVIARTAAALTGLTGRPFDESELLEQARQNSVGRLWHRCQHLRHAADPHGVAQEHKDAVEARRLQLTACEDGTVLVGGQLDSVGGATLRTALEPLARPGGVGDDRDRARRLADALVELATHTLDAGWVPQHAGQRPHLQVTASLETLAGWTAALAGEMEYSEPVATKTVQRLACDATLNRILLGPESAVIDVGRARRVVSATTRRALNARDRTCRWPGCDRPASWSAAHHVVHWACGGATDLSNLILLCHRHHWMIHEGGWQLVRANDGRLVTIPSTSSFVTRARAPDGVAVA